MFKKNCRTKASLCHLSSYGPFLRRLELNQKFENRVCCCWLSVTVWERVPGSRNCGQPIWLKLGAEVGWDEIFQKPLWLTSLSFSFRVSGGGGGKVGSHFLPFEHQKSSLPALVNCSAKCICPWTLLQSFQVMHVTLSSRYWTERSLAKEFGQSWCLNYNPTPFFKYSTHLRAVLHNFYTYTIVSFSHPIIKISWEKFGLF